MPTFVIEISIQQNRIGTKEPNNRVQSLLPDTGHMAHMPGVICPVSVWRQPQPLSACGKVRFVKWLTYGRRNCVCVLLAAAQ